MPITLSLSSDKKLDYPVIILACEALYLLEGGDFYNGGGFKILSESVGEGGFSLYLFLSYFIFLTFIEESLSIEFVSSLYLSIFKDGISIDSSD